MLCWLGRSAGWITSRHLGVTGDLGVTLWGHQGFSGHCIINPHLGISTASSESIRMYLTAVESLRRRLGL